MANHLSRAYKEIRRVTTSIDLTQATTSVATKVCKLTVAAETPGVGLKTEVLELSINRLLAIRYNSMELLVTIKCEEALKMWVLFSFSPEPIWAMPSRKAKRTCTTIELASDSLFSSHENLSQALMW